MPFDVIDQRRIDTTGLGGNLGLGDSATLDVGAASGTVAAGDDARIVGAAFTLPTFSGASSATIPSSITRVYVEDRQARFRHVASEPSHALKFQNDSRWFEIDEPFISPEMAGAVGDYDPATKTGTNDTASIMNGALCAVSQGKPFVISQTHLISFSDYGTVNGLDRDTYGNRYALFFYDLASVQIVGAGGALYVGGTDREDYAIAIHAELCDRVSISGDLTIDWVNRPFIQGTVTAIEASYVELVCEWAPTFSDVQRVNLWDRDSRLPTATIRDRPAGNYDVGSTLTQVSGLTYRISRTSGTWDVSNLSIGDLISADHQIYGASPVSSYRTDTVLIGSGLKIRHGAGIAVWLRSGRYAAVQDIEVDTVPGEDTLLSVSSDGVHISGFEKRYIKRNTIRRTGDDTINSNEQGTIVSSQASGTSITVQYTFPFCIPYVGDRIKFVNIDTAEVIYANVVSTTEPTDPPIGGANGTFGLVVDADVGDVTGGDWVVIFASDNRVEEISDNTVGWNRGRGILSSSASTRVLRNRIEKSGVGVLCDTYGVEFGATTYTIVSENTVIECNLPAFETPAPAAVHVRGAALGGGTATRLLGTVIATGNKTIRSGNTAVQIEGALKAFITDTDMYDVASDPYPFPISLGSDPLSVAFVDCGQAYAGGNRNLGGSALGIGVVDVDFFSVGSNENIINPFSAEFVGGGFNSMRPLSIEDAANFWQMQGNVSGFGPVLQSTGSDANIPAILAAKGYGSAQLFSNGKPAIEGYNANETAVNWIRANGQISGYEVSLEAIGADANIDFIARGKGNGVFGFGSWTTSEDVSVNGYIRIKDSAGNVRKLATIA